MFGTDGTSHFKVSLPCKLINLLLFLIALRNSDLEVPSKIDIFSRTSNRSFYEMFGTDGTSHFKVSLLCKLINLLLFLIALRNSTWKLSRNLKISRQLPIGEFMKSYAQMVLRFSNQVCKSKLVIFTAISHCVAKLHLRSCSKN